MEKVNKNSNVIDLSKVVKVKKEEEEQKKRALALKRILAYADKLKW